MNNAFHDYIASKANIFIPTESPLDRVMPITFFNDQFAMKKSEGNCTLRSLVDQIENTVAPSKAALPWLKLAKFGDRTSVRGSLRNDDNLIEIHGIEADYDGEHVSLWHAERVLKAACLAAIVYTSPSHTEERPRWRVLCPTSGPMPADARTGLLARVNGLFVGALAGESFTLSQSYYFGHVEGATQHRVIVVEGRAIDQAVDLDAGAMGKPVKVQTQQPYTPPVPSAYVSRPDGCSPYALAALERECANITNAGNGSKHPAVNKAGYSIGGLVSGGELDAVVARNAMANALESIRSQCKDFGAAQRTMERSYQDGYAASRTAPPRQEGEPDYSDSLLYMNLVNQANAIKIQEARPMPSGILDIGGVIGDFINHCTSTTKAQHPLLALASAIAMVGAVAGRKYRTETDLRTNVYTIAIAGSGAGKGHAPKRVTEALNAAGLPHYLGGVPESANGLITSIKLFPSKIIQIDECGDFLKAVMDKNTSSPVGKIAQKLKILFSSADTIFLGGEYADQSAAGKPREDIHEPNLCISGCTTPNQLWSIITPETMEDGFLARLMVFVTPKNYPGISKGRPAPIPQSIIDALIAIDFGADAMERGNLTDAIRMSSKLKPSPYTVPMDQEASDMCEELDTEQNALQNKHEADFKASLWGRLVENSIKLALIRAISNAPRNPIIRKSDLIWGKLVAIHCIQTMARDFTRNVAGSEYEKRCNRLKEYLRKKPMQTLGDLKRNGWIFKASEQQEIIDGLVLSGEVQRFDIAASPSGGKGCTRYSLAVTDAGADSED